MRRLIIRTAAFVTVALLCFFALLSTADGRTDPFYIRFTTPPQESLILGTSRAAQGLIPSVINEKCDINIFNYAFTIGQSPYGPTYLNSIKKKLQENTTNGTFILTVDPWSISSKSEDPNDVVNFREKEQCLGNTHWVNANPNFEYLIKNMKGNYLGVLFPQEDRLFLHKDGWLETSVAMDPLSVEQRLNSKITTYKKNNLPKYKFSSTRLAYLIETIKFLKNHGSVYLVRLPIHPEMMKIEDQLMLDFNEKINGITELTEGYYDMTFLNDKVIFTDGNHLYKESGKYVSGVLADWILAR